MIQKIKEKKIIKGCFILLLVTLIICTTNYLNNSNTVLAKVTEKVEEKLKKIRVDIKGYVINPGVYELNENSRVIDVINLAGGLKEGSNTNLINLSKKLKDEMVIIIYSNEEIEQYKQSKIKTEYVYNTEYIYIEVDSCPDDMNGACISDYKATNNELNGKVNINTASIDELTKLPGIGTSKAEAIIDYRINNGDFKNINDISNVNGIGKSMFEKIKDNITV